MDKNQRPPEDSRGSCDGPETNEKLARRASFRRRLGALIRGGVELPAAINRGLQPLKRSFSFGKDLHRLPRVSAKTSHPPALPPLSSQPQPQPQLFPSPPASPSPSPSPLPRRTSNVRWYNSLGSLAEDEYADESEPAAASSSRVRTSSSYDRRTNSAKKEERVHQHPARTQSLAEGFFLDVIPASPEGRRGSCNSSIDSNSPPCEASSLPVLPHCATDEDDDNRTTFRCYGKERQQVEKEWENLMVSAQNFTLLRSRDCEIASQQRLQQQRQHQRQRSVRSRSLTQLDALGGSMLDAGEHRLEIGSSSATAPLPQQPPSHQRQTTMVAGASAAASTAASTTAHQPQNVLQCAAAAAAAAPSRFLVPNVPPPAESVHPNRPRHKLSRSQVSSSEYFSVSFEVGEDSGTFDREEFLPAAKGTYLVDALNAACERRGIDLSRVDVLFDAFSGALPLQTTETSYLGGKHLRITAKDEKSEKANARSSSSQRGGQNIPLRKTSGNYRGRGGSGGGGGGSSSNRFFSVSTEDSSVDSEATGTAFLASGRTSTAAAGLKASKQRWSGFFTNSKGTRMDILTAQLDEYDKHGVPKLPETQLPYELALNEEALYSLEEDWRDIVRNSEELSEKQRQQQTALWELAQTEVAYIRTLKVVSDLFMACLCNLQASNILNEVDRTRLFGNIPEIYAANRYFWTEHLLTMLNASRSTGQPLDPGHLLHGFDTFERTFAPYTRYCTEQSRCQQYCRDRLNDNQLFTAYLVWCETQKDCNRLKLLDILVKPMQRLTKYSLLLKAVHKNTENEEQRAELTHMIKSVDDFVASVNAALRRSEETARLAGAASRIESYDVVESRDEELDKLVKIHSSLDIVSAPIPGCSKDILRTLVREGDLKLRDAATSKMEVHVLLLTDMLLICKPTTKKASSSGGSSSGGGGGGGGVGGGSGSSGGGVGGGGGGAGGGGGLTGGAGCALKIIRQPYIVDRIRVHELKESSSSLGLVYLNEYGAASAALVLSAGESKLAKSWSDSLRKAQQQFALMKMPPLGNTTNILAGGKQAGTFLGDAEYEVATAAAAAAAAAAVAVDESGEGIPPRTPRGSSRASRVSSLAHSHSGSMEMEGVSLGSSSFLPSYNPSKNVSVETTELPRASSVSSEEGGEIACGHDHRPLLQMRRALLSKSPTPNTLSVQVPAYSSLGQSLPNLTLATSPQTSTVSPTPPNSLLIVPQITKSKETLLSPGHRGISYPPPSPPRGALRRAFAIPQSRNPPLIKTRHVNTTVTQTVQATASMTSVEAEAIEERRRRLEPLQRMPSTSSGVVEEKK